MSSRDDIVSTVPTVRGDRIGDRSEHRREYLVIRRNGKTEHVWLPVVTLDTSPADAEDHAEERMAWGLHPDHD